jgi:hypothetical protein
MAGPIGTVIGGVDTHKDTHVVAALTEQNALLGTAAYYGEFVQGERRKANGQFGLTRTVVSVMPRGLEQRWRVEAMSMVDVQLVG